VTSVLHVLTLSGTLLPRTTAAWEISRAMGRLSRFAEGEARRADDLDAPVFERAAADVGAQDAALTDELADSVIDSAPWIVGIDRVLADIRRRGDRSVVVSAATPARFMERLQDHLGVDGVLSASYGDRFDAASEVSAIYREIAAGTETGIVGYFSTRQDLPLLRALPGIPTSGACAGTVSVNSAPDVRTSADVTYDGSSLWGAYLRGRRLLPGHLGEVAA
jgi:phosphoserine phosphatase